MVERVEADGFQIIFGQEGRKDWGKYSFPVLYGLPVKVKWNKYEYDFNLRGNLKRISGRSPSWPNQLEQLKRTDGNGFIYYGIFGYEATYYMIKNYYVPFNGISDPPVFNEEPFTEEHIPRALDNFDEFIEIAGEIAPTVEDEKGRSFLELISGRNRAFLSKDAERLHDIIGGCIPVLPPDTLEVDYEVVPLMVMDGCIYRCKFCAFKGDTEFAVREKSDVDRQIALLKSFFGKDLINYNSLLLGQNDALAAGTEIIEYAINAAYDKLGFGESYHHGANLFLFGSVASLMDADEQLFEILQASPYHTYINIGFESPHTETLSQIGKPITGPQVVEAFQRAGEINGRYDSIRVSGNFVLGESLPAGHLETIKELLANAPVHSGKDTIYLSPIIGDCERMQIRNDLTDIKRTARPDVFLYLVQSL